LHTAAGGAWLSRNIALEDEQNLRATFIQAAGAGDLRLVSFVLKYIPTVFYNNAKVNGDTALIAAVKNRHDAVVNRLLMVPNIDVNATDRIRSTALMCALDDLAYGPANNDVVMRLLAVPAIEVNVQDDVGATALMFAASNGNTHAVEWLLARNDIDVNLFNQFGNTALSLAVGDGHPEAAKRLLAAPGIDVISEDDEGMTALTLAQEHLQEPQRSTVIALIQARQIEQEKEEAEELSYEQGGV
jgi:ankyrin repeat protein